MNKVFELIDKEASRQENEVCLIASENYMSKDVLKANGSVLVNKYAEGYPNKRYYGGCHVVDEIEQLAIEEACQLFGSKYANVQPNSGCQANQAIYMSLLYPGDRILAMSVDAGGHISHSLGIGMAGTFYKVETYGLDDNGYLNYDELKEKLYSFNPNLLVVGASAYPREIDFKKIKDILDEYNQKSYRFPLEYTLPKDFVCEKEYEFYAAKTNYQEGFVFCPGFNVHKGDTYEIVYENNRCKLMVDMAHIAGLVAVGEHMSPIPYADVVTSTVQKTLRSGRGGLILTNDDHLIKKINSAVFPRLQGGPLENMIAGKAVGFAEALQPEFKDYIITLLKNIQAMTEVFKEHDIDMVSGGSDNHLILLDLKKEKFSGADLEANLEKCGIIVNKNAVKNDPRPKMQTSGIRLGTAAITTRGANTDDCKWIASQISVVIEMMRDNYPYDDGMDMPLEFSIIRKNITKWCEEHPIYD